ncbi:MAG: aldo/keto reductase [Planctomycetota bacterium]|nr:MAG: aldo/keto reductase [Planctomycetota bacterium]
MPGARVNASKWASMRQLPATVAKTLLAVPVCRRGPLWSSVIPRAGAACSSKPSSSRRCLARASSFRAVSSLVSPMTTPSLSAPLPLTRKPSGYCALPSMPMPLMPYVRERKMSSSSAAPKPQISPERLVLGAAGLGMAYGRPDAQGRPAQRPDPFQVQDTLAAAWQLGIRCIDTAPAYGRSEELIGRYWQGAVWSKTDPTSDLGQSLRALRRQRLELLQWHNFSISTLHDSGFLARWRSLAADERIAELGVSVYTGEEALAALALPQLRMVQLPWNLLARWPLQLCAPGLRQHGVRIAVRSVYLQGLLAGRQPPPAASSLALDLDSCARIAAELGLPLPVLALRAALEHPDIDQVVVGCDHPDQVSVLAQALAAPALPADLALPPALPHRPAVDPRTW